MTLYVYCLIEKSGEVSDLIGIQGIQKQEPQRINAAAFQAVVSPFSGQKISPDKESVYAHERVIDRCMAVATPLPFRFGTVVSDTDLQKFAAAQDSGLRADFDRVRGCVEMGVKVSWPKAEAFPMPPADSNEGPGARFLRAKRQKYATAKQTELWLNEAVADLLRDSNSSQIGPDGSIVRIAHLVPRGRLEPYREQLEKRLQTRPDAAFLRSGPWPPYSFVSTPM